MVYLSHYAFFNWNLILPDEGQVNPIEKAERDDRTIWTNRRGAGGGIKMEIDWGVAGIAIVLWLIMMTLFVTGLGMGASWVEVLGWPKFIMIAAVALPLSYVIVLWRANA